jgi:hypothetical protein
MNSMAAAVGVGTRLLCDGEIAEIIELLLAWPRSVDPCDLSPSFRAVVTRVEGSNRWTSRAFRTLLG